MDVKDELTQNLYDILDDLIDRATSSMKRSNESRKEQPTRNNESDKNISLSNLSYKDLSNTKEKLNALKDDLKKNPRKYQSELAKIQKVENKIDHAMERRKDKDINKAVTALQKNPRRYVLKVAETKIKLETLKNELEKNPRRHKTALEKVNKLNGRIDNKIDHMKTRQINKAIYVIRKNPQKYEKEYNKFKEIENKLNKQSAKTKSTENKKTKQKEPAKPKEKELELSL